MPARQPQQPCHACPLPSPKAAGTSRLQRCQAGAWKAKPRLRKASRGMPGCTFPAMGGNLRDGKRGQGRP